jgi:enoyl-CoA hydratase/carnithine racemase
MADQIIATTNDGVRTLCLNRPDKKNALNEAMYAQLVAELEAAERDETIRLIVFTGAAQVFTAGNDMADFLAFATSGGDLRSRSVIRFLHLLARFDKPLVAAVPGLAVGIGATLLLHCDYVLLAESAILSFPFVKLGLVPEAASSLLLPARIGHVRAFAALVLGETITASTALAWGLCNQVVPDALLDQATRDICRALATRAPGAVAATKRLLRGEGVEAKIAAELDVFEERMRSPEARAAFEAFLAGKATASR